MTVNQHDRPARALRSAIRILRSAGIDPIALAAFPANCLRYLQDLRSYRGLVQQSTARVDGPLSLYPVFRDARKGAGSSYGHYFHQDLWAAERLVKECPESHVDIGSRIDGFVAHLLAAGLTVTVVDIRPLPEPIKNLHFIQEDATVLPSFDDESIHSLSCLHAMEHFGLGRYGDRLDPAGPVKFCDLIQRKLAPGGRLLISVPIGTPRTEFNAHRVLRPKALIELLPGLTLTEFAAVDDAGRLIPEADPSAFATARFSLGLYAFERTSRR